MPAITAMPAKAPIAMPAIAPAPIFPPPLLLSSPPLPPLPPLPPPPLPPVGFTPGERGCVSRLARSTSRHRTCTGNTLLIAEVLKVERVRVVVVTVVKAAVYVDRTSFKSEVIVVVRVGMVVYVVMKEM